MKENKLYLLKKHSMCIICDWEDDMKNKVSKWLCRQTERETVILEWGLGWEKHHPSMSEQSSSLSLITAALPQLSHTHSHVCTNRFLPWVKYLEKTRKIKAKEPKEGLQRVQRHSGEWRSRWKRTWQTNWAIRENYEHVYRSGNIILY